MSTFRDEIEHENRHITRVPCTVDTILKQLAEHDAEEVREAIEDPEVKGTAIARVIARKFNIVIAPGAIQRHRRRTWGQGCKCA